MKTDQLSAPLMTTVDITNRCNLRCAYCYAHNEGGIDMPSEMVLRTIRALHGMGVWQIVIGGGEPFLHRDILLILETLLSEGIEVGLVTNATTVSKHQLDSIADLSLRYSQLFHIQVSIDSATPEVNDRLRGCGSKVLENIDRLVAHGITLSTCTVIHRYNVDYLGELIFHLYPGVKKFHFTELMPSYSVRDGRWNLYPTRDQMRRAIGIIEEYKAMHRDITVVYPDVYQSIRERWKPTLVCRGCTGAVTRMDITAKGDALACNIADEAKLGSLTEETVVQIWGSERAQKYRDSPRPLCQPWAF